MSKTCFCGIAEHCGYQIETDMEQHDKVIYEQGYSDAIREFAERLIEEFETVVKQKAEEREHNLVNVSECDCMMLGLAVAISIAKELADMKG